MVYGGIDLGPSANCLERDLKLVASADVKVPSSSPQLHLPLVNAINAWSIGNVANLYDNSASTDLGKARQCPSDMNITTGVIIDAHKFSDGSSVILPYPDCIYLDGTDLDDCEVVTKDKFWAHGANSTVGVCPRASSSPISRAPAPPTTNLALQLQQHASTTPSIR